MSAEGVAATSFTVEVREPGRLPLVVVVTDRLPIGRAGIGLVLTDQRLSRNHCELRVVGGGLVVQDLGSSNGTFVDGVPAEQPIALGIGGLVHLGDSTVVVVDSRAAAAPADALGASAAAGADTVVGRPGGRARKSGDAPKPIVTSVVGGTLTMAFTDIVGSTALNARIGDRAWFELLQHHDLLVRACLAANGGTEVKGQGDGFLLTFASARRALCFATDLQARLAGWRAEGGEPLHVRVGVHTGEVIHDAGDLFGGHVNFAARIAALAGADEIVVSELVHALAAPMGDFDFGPVREVELKGFAGPHQIRTVTAR